MSTICLECGIATAVGPEMGHMGLPSLDETPRGRGRHRLSSKLSSGGEADTDETFGCLYSGLSAVGLFTHPIETYRDFLAKHQGKKHRLYCWLEEHEELPGDYEGMKYRFIPYKRPRKAPGFIWARVRFSCTQCEEHYESSAAEWVRPAEAHRLTTEKVQLFQRRTVEPSEHNIRDAWPLQILLFDDFENWLRHHGRHIIVVELLQEDTLKSRVTKRRRKRGADAGESLVVPEPWTPLTIPPEEDERLFGAVSDEGLTLLTRIHHREAAVRSDSAKALGRRGEPGTLAYLVPLLDDPVEAVRVAAVKAIGVLPAPRRIRPIGFSLLDESEAVRNAAGQILSRQGISRNEALEKARAPRGPVDDKAQQAGRKAGTDGRLELILKDAVHPHHSSRGDAAEKLRSRDKRAVRTIVAMLADYSGYVVTDAAESAGALGIREAVEPLLVADSVHEQNSRVRQSIMQALGQIGDPQGVPTLLRGLQDEEQNVRREVVEALSGLEGAAGTTALVKALKSKHGDARQHAAYFLGKRRDVEAVPALVAALGDKEYFVRSEAAEALVQIDDPKGLQALVEAAAKGDSAVALRAHEFLIGKGDSRTEKALVEAVREAERYGFGSGVATRYILSGNKKLASAGKWSLGGRKPKRNVKPILWGSKRG